MVALAAHVREISDYAYSASFVSPLQDRDRELEKHNIYYHRFLKGSSKKGIQIWLYLSLAVSNLLWVLSECLFWFTGSENKMVQTDAFVLLPTEAANLLEFGYTETEERLEKQESSVNWVWLK